MDNRKESESETDQQESEILLVLSINKRKKSDDLKLDGRLVIESCSLQILVPFL